MPRTKTLSDAALDVLRRSTITETSVTLPEQLEEKLYKEVNAALVAFGGKWNRKQGAHLFDRDPRAALEAAIDDGVQPVPVDPDKALSFFPTPREIAERMVNELADVPAGALVLEPSAGDGAIASVIRERRPDLQLVCVEVDEGRAGQLEAAGFDVHRGRFQDFAAGCIEDFDAIVMNPPFTEPDDKLAYVEHVRLAWSLLAPGGRLQAIVSEGFQFRQDRRVRELRELMCAAGAGWSELGEGAFKESGTMFRTLLLDVSAAEAEEVPDPEEWAADPDNSDGLGVANQTESGRVVTNSEPHPLADPETPGDTTTMTVTADAPEQAREDFDRILHIDPATLVIGTNVRLDPRLDKGFIQSIKENGVLDAIAAYYDADGHLVVHRGQRRTLGAIQARRPTIPVRVIEKPEGADHVVRQIIENDQRAAMLSGERAKAVEQLGLEYGLTAGQIARKLGKKKETVETELAVARSELAVRAADKYELDLVQAAAVAEFDDDPETAKALVVAVKNGQFEHVLATARRERDLAAERERIIAELAEQKIPVVDRPEYGDATTYLNHMNEFHSDEAKAEHARTCEGHAVAVFKQYDRDLGRDKWLALPVCVDPVANGHDAGHSRATAQPKVKMADLPPAEQAEKRREKRAVIENNKAWTAAVEVRRKWLAEFLQRKTAPAGAEAFIAAELMRGSWWLTRGRGLMFELLGVTTGPAIDQAEKASPKRAVLLTLGHVLAGWETTAGSDDVGRSRWRNHNDDDRRILSQMVDWGYPASPVEQLILNNVKGLVEAPPVGTPLVQVLAAFADAQAESQAAAESAPEVAPADVDEPTVDDEPADDEEQPLEEEGGDEEFEEQRAEEERVGAVVINGTVVARYEHFDLTPVEEEDAEPVTA